MLRTIRSLTRRISHKEVSQLARKKGEDSYTLPDLQARGLAALCEDFFNLPGMEDEYQAWLANKKGTPDGGCKNLSAKQNSDRIS